MIPGNIMIMIPGNIKSNHCHQKRNETKHTQMCLFLKSFSWQKYLSKTLCKTGIKSLPHGACTKRQLMVDSDERQNWLKGKMGSVEKSGDSVNRYWSNAPTASVQNVRVFLTFPKTDIGKMQSSVQSVQLQKKTSSSWPRKFFSERTQYNPIICE